MHLFGLNACGPEGDNGELHALGGEMPAAPSKGRCFLASQNSVQDSGAARCKGNGPEGLH